MIPANIKLFNVTIPHSPSFDFESTHWQCSPLMNRSNFASYWSQACSFSSVALWHHLHWSPVRNVLHCYELCAEPVSASRQAHLSLCHSCLGFHSLSSHSAYFVPVSNALAAIISPSSELIHLKNAAKEFYNKVGPGDHLSVQNFTLSAPFIRE